jgi:DNA-directed RNA polymerases I, II, and III subunit RPABC1
MNELSKYYSARKTTLEMIKDRKYLVNDEDLNMDFDTFKIYKQNNDLDLYFEHENKELPSIYVKFYQFKKKLSETELKKEISVISVKTGHEDEYNNDPNIIFVTLEKSNQNVYNLIKHEKLRNVELFVISELLFNPSKSIYVPKHEKLPKDQEKELLEIYNTTKNNLPKILSTDKIIRYYGMKSGDICKITRNSEVIGYEIVFKLVR